MAVEKMNNVHGKLTNADLVDLLDVIASCQDKCDDAKREALKHEEDVEVATRNFNQAVIAKLKRKGKIKEGERVTEDVPFIIVQDGTPEHWTCCHTTGESTRIKSSSVHLG